MSAVLPRTTDSAWRPVLVTAGLVLAVTLAAYWQTASAMVAIWSRSDTFAHAFLVPPIVGWLIWRQRRALAARVPRPTAGALLPIAVASAAWLLGDLAASNAVAQLAFTALLVLVIVATIGPAASRTIAFPLGFLFFSVPIGEFLMPVMMQWTADFTVLALRLTGVPVYREGLQFIVPSGNWSVVEACSGIRYLIASIMVGTLFAYLNYRSLRRRLIFVGVSIAVPIVANWMRAYLIVLIGDLSGNAAAVSADHIVYGWIFFGFVITVMFLIGARWSEAPAEAGATGLDATSGSRQRVGRLVAVVGLGTAMLIVLPHLALRAMLAAGPPGRPLLVAPVSLADRWTLEAEAAPVWAPAFKGAAADFNRIYAKPGASPVGVYVGYYRHQNYATKLVSSENTVVTLHDPDWSAIDTRLAHVEIGGKLLDWQATRLRGAGHVAVDTSVRRQVWQIYWIDGALTADQGWAKASIAFERLLGRGDDAAVILVHAADPQDGSAEANIAGFLKTNLGALQRCLAAARAGRGSAGPDANEALGSGRPPT